MSPVHRKLNTIQALQAQYNLIAQYNFKLPSMSTPLSSSNMTTTAGLSHHEDISMADASSATSATSHPTLQSRATDTVQTADTPFALPKEFKPAAVKLDNIERLEGQNNYEDWASQMAMVFDAMRVYDIVIEGSELDISASSSSEHARYQALSKHALLILIQVISKSILKKVSKYRSPHRIWKYLKETYYRDTAFSFVHQVAGLCLLSSKCEKGKPVSEFMDKFDDQWNRVYEMTTGPDPYCQKLRAFLEEDFAKRDFLLTALSEHYPNPVDNLTTKADLSYAEARHRMNSLCSNNQLGDTVSDTALVINKSAYRAKGHRSKPTTSQPTTKVCSYCKRHGGTYEGHFWQECRKLKRDQKQKQAQAHAHAQPPFSQTPQTAQTGLIVQAPSSAMDLDLPNVQNSLSNLNRVMEL